MTRGAGRPLASPPRPAHIPAMHITLNGEQRPLDAPTVAALLERLGLDRRKVAVERNTAIVPRSEYEGTALAPGDQIEIVHFIGGG